MTDWEWRRNKLNEYQNIQNIYKKLDKKEELDSDDLTIAAEFIVKNSGEALIKPQEIAKLKTRFDTKQLLREPKQELANQTLILKYISNKAAAGLLLKINNIPKCKEEFKKNLDAAIKKTKKVNGKAKLERYNFASLSKDFGGKIKFDEIKHNDIQKKLEDAMPESSKQHIKDIDDKLDAIYDNFIHSMN